MPSYNKEKAFKRKLKKITECRLPKKSLGQLDVELEKQKDSDDFPKPSDCIPAGDEIVVSKSSFKSLKGKLTDMTYKNILDMGYETMTEVQERVIPRLLDDPRPNCIVTAKTGSGKTLAFLTVAVEFISQIGFRPYNGTGAIIISPTREVAMQTFGILEILRKNHSQTTGLIMGGENKKEEEKKLIKGVNILVATPGRLLYHLKHTKDFHFNKVACLIIDEADRMLDFGFKEQIEEINNILALPDNVKRLYMFFGATKSKRTVDFARFMMKTKYVDYHVGETNIENLEQAYIEIEAEDKFKMLAAILKKYSDKKIMVFFNSVAVVQYYEKLLNTTVFNQDYLEKPVLSIHSDKKQNARARTFLKFCRAESGVLLCTDIAARGWDIPAVHWIVQFDPPTNPDEYIQRIGRTARAGQSGYALLFLTKEELGLLSLLKRMKVIVHPAEASCPPEDVQESVEKIIVQEKYFKISATAAFKGFLRSYKSHQLKDVYDYENLDLFKIAKCLGLTKVPFIDPELRPTRRKIMRSKHTYFEPA